MTSVQLGRVTVITGAAGGLGSETAKLLASRGHRLALVDIRTEELDSLRSQLPTDVDALCLSRDIGDALTVESIIPEVVDRFGRVDVLVNSAAILARRDLNDVTAESLMHVFEVNMRPVFLLSRAVMPHMARQGWGRIVNVTSTGVYEGGFTMTSAAYESSKGAVAVLTKMFARYGAPHGVLVNSVCPGGMLTRMLTEQTPAEMIEKAVAELIPLGRLAHPSEVANMVAWLVSDENSYATGSEFDITGGLALH